MWSLYGYIKRCTALYIHLTYNVRCNCAILLNHVIACTYYEIITYVLRNNILHCWYIKVLYVHVLVVPIMSGDKLAHETISCCHFGFKGFLKAVFQILSDKVHRCIHPNITISSALTRAWKGLRAHTDNLKMSALWTPSQAQNHSKTTTASDSPSSGPLEFESNGSEIVSFRLNQTTPHQWLTNRMVARCTEIFLQWPKRYWCQPGNTTSYM